MKILANATSYGIFIELNVDDPDEVESPIQIHASAGSRVAKSAKRENPGDFFHPLLGTLITGAARLMLAITERLLLDEGLDWIFCDTDSMAFAGPAKIPLNEFEKRVRSVCGWFDALNPYEQPGSILEFEDQNFAIDLSRGKRLEPLYCAAISAKRYALFNLDDDGEPIIRKASAHGLGHLLSPYDDGPKSDERESGVRQWQEDLWKEIIKSLRSANPLEVRFDWRPELNHPAVSQYTAATPDLQARFRDFNRDKPYALRVKTFNFLLEFYGKRPDEMARQGLLKSSDDTKRQPKPSAPYNRDPYKSLPRICDRVTGYPSGASGCAATPRRYADTIGILKPNSFMAKRSNSGHTQRRHVFVEAIEDIGKEADKWDDEEPLTADSEFTVSYGVSETDRSKMLSVIRSVSKRRLARAARVSTRTIPLDEPVASEMPVKEFRRLFDVASSLAADDRERKFSDQVLVQWISEQIERCGVTATAKRLDYDAANLSKVVSGKRALPSRLRKRVGELLNTDG